MRKIFTFMLLAAALLVSVPSWARLYPDGTQRNLGYYNLPEITTFSTSNSFGTICVPERIVATQGITIYDILCVDKFYNGGKNDGNSDTTKVARLVLEAHTVCNGIQQTYYDGDQWYETYDERFCPEGQGTGANSCDGKVYIDWAYNYDEETQYDYRMKAGASYFYTACSDTKLADRKIYVDTEDVATAPAGVNGFWGTFEQTTINTPVTVLTQDVGTNKQFLEQVTKATIPAHRGYFKGNFECVPWRWNTHDTEPHPFKDTKETPNDIHYPCSEPPKVPRRVSSNAIAFNVGRDGNGLYTIDFEHPIYLNKETNKRIENGQLIIEAADGSIYNAFGLKLR